jgi:hypothetical protein
MAATQHLLLFQQPSCGSQLVPFPCCGCSRVSTPVKRKNRDFAGGGRDYGSGQINAYPPVAPGGGVAGAAMMTLAEELLSKKGLSLKQLQVRGWQQRTQLHWVGLYTTRLQAAAATTTVLELRQPAHHVFMCDHCRRTSGSRAGHTRRGW